MTPSRSPPVLSNHLFAVARSFVAGESFTRLLVFKFCRGKDSSCFRRSDNGVARSDFPAVSPRRSKTINKAGCAAASFWTRLAPGRKQNRKNMNIKKEGTDAV